MLEIGTITFKEPQFFWSMKLRKGQVLLVTAKVTDEANKSNIRTDRNNSINARDKWTSKISYIHQDMFSRCSGL